MQSLCATNAFAATRRRVAGRRTVSVKAQRTLWLPSATAPAHLDGTLPGDNGFDPLGLGVDKGRLAWYKEAELTNGRWAMAATAGILFTDALGVGGKWYETGAQDFGFPIPALLAIEFLVLGFLETTRYDGWKKTGKSGLVNMFPFDPLKMASNDMAVKEVKNGRLAMVAFVGFAVQALVTRQGPVSNLTGHLSDPFNKNFIGSILNLPSVIGN